MNMLELMAAPFAECMVLVAIHTYLGIHVLRRRVIFVDLALAQTAALGTTVGFLFGIMPDTVAALVFSMTFTFIAAAIFALTRIRSDRVPQEAVIGLFYAITAAMAVLVVQKTQGAEHLESILVGGILWVKWPDVITAAVAYAIIGVVHYVFRKRFLLISENPEEAYEQGISVRAWDFLFYLTFGFVISFSVRVAGVLLVFVFLVAPAIMAFVITNRLKWQLVIGWTMGTLVTIVGLYLSYVIDLPSGPTVVAFYGVVLAAGAVVVYVIRAERKPKALAWLGVGLIAAGAVTGLVYLEGRWLADTALSEGGSQAHQQQHHAAEAEARHAAEAAPAPEVDSAVLAELIELAGERLAAERAREYCALDDADARLEFIRAEAARQPKALLPLLTCYLNDEETPLFFRSEAVDLLRDRAGDDFGYDPELEPGENKAALKKMRAACAAEPAPPEQRRHRQRQRRRRGGD